jgi:hypothetical protein
VCTAPIRPASVDPALQLGTRVSREPTAARARARRPCARLRCSTDAAGPCRVRTAHGSGRRRDHDIDGLVADLRSPPVFGDIGPDPMRFGAIAQPRRLRLEVDTVDSFDIIGTISRSTNIVRI